jgi:hypothetical protein
MKYALQTNAYLPSESHTNLVQKWLYNLAKERKADTIQMQVKEDIRFVQSLQIWYFIPLCFFILMMPILL